MATIKRKRLIPWAAKQRTIQHSLYLVDDFYHSTVWRKLRNAFINDNPLCKYCLIADKKNTPAFVVDHIVGVIFGGDCFDEQNLQSLCNHHHVVKSGFEAHSKIDPITAKIYPKHPLIKHTNPNQH